ncbi:MAG: hypothetical protein ACXABI_09460 [Candidatus Hodarchaeales archaeon]|jgi:hypothetical protein
MAGKRIVVYYIHCSINPANQEKAPGFQVIGYKNPNNSEIDAKIGFIISGVKILIFQQMKRVGVRTRMKWIPKGFEIREEVHPLNGVIIDPQRTNNILFVSKEDNSMVVMQGEPITEEKGFLGQIINIRWDGSDVSIDPPKGTLLHCVLDSRNHRVDCLVK